MPAWRIDSIAPSSCSTTRGERPSESSSMRNSLGRVMVAMARASICCWPPERLAARSVAPRGQGGERGEGLVDHVGVVLAAPAALPGRHAQVVLHAQVGEDPLAAGHLGHAEAGDLVGRQVGDVAPVEDDGAVVGLDHPADGPQQGRLAGAVGADEGDDLPLADLDGHVGQHNDAVVAHAELAHGQQRQPAGLAVGQHLVPGAHGGPHVLHVASDEAAGAGHDEPADDEDGDQDEQAVAEAHRVAHRPDDRQHEEAGQHEQRADGEADGAHPRRDGEGERGEHAGPHDGQREVDAGVADEGQRDVGGQREEHGEPAATSEATASMRKTRPMSRRARRVAMTAPTARPRRSKS